MVFIAPVAPPGVGLVYSANNVRLRVNEKVIDKGTLYISQSSLAWQPNSLADGIAISWKQISVHGISNNPSKSIYFMLDHKLIWPGVYDGPPPLLNGAHLRRGEEVVAPAPVALPMEQQHVNGNADDEDEGNVTDEGEIDNLEEDEDEHMTECWLLPEDVNTVDVMFQTMTECQALHPDSADSFSEESDFMDDDGDDDDDANAPVLGGRPGDAGNQNNDDAASAQGGIENLSINDERFADADE